MLQIAAFLLQIVPIGAAYRSKDMSDRSKKRVFRFTNKSYRSNGDAFRFNGNVYRSKNKGNRLKRLVFRFSRKLYRSKYNVYLSNGWTGAVKAQKFIN